MPDRPPCSRVERVVDRHAADAKKNPHGMDKLEITAAVIDLLSQGILAKEIQSEMLRKYQISLTQQQPYVYIAYGANRGWIQSLLPARLQRGLDLRRAFPELLSVDVTPSVVAKDIAHQAARRLAPLVRTRATDDREVHIGFVGGVTMRELMRGLARQLDESAADVPRLVLHPLSAGFDTDDPSTAPSSFGVYFTERPRLADRVRFHLLNAPAVVTGKEIEATRKLVGIRDAVSAAARLDFILASVADACDPHNSLVRWLSQFPGATGAAGGADWIGDMLWCPVAQDGPACLGDDPRAFTIVDLADLPRRIAHGTRVLVVAGPCRVCQRPRVDTLGALLARGREFVTDLVIDGRSADALLPPTAQ